MALNSWARLALGHGEGELSSLELFDLASNLNFISGHPNTWEEFTGIVSSRHDFVKILDGSDETQRVIQSLEAIFFFAVTSSPNKATYIELIFKLDEDSVAALKQVVEEQQAVVRSLDTPVVQVEEKHTHVQLEKNDEPESKNCITGSVDAFELQDLVDSLRLKLAEFQQREEESLKVLQSVRQKSLEDEIRAHEFSQMAQRLDSEQNSAMAKTKKMLEDCIEQVKLKDARIVELTDRLDVSAECLEKLTQAQAQMAKYKEKIEELSDVKERLTAEQEARSCLVEKVLSLECQVATMPPLKKQLEEYKKRVTSAELEIRDLKREAERNAKLSAEMDAQQRSLALATEAHLSNAAALKQELDQASQRMTSSSGVGLGATELSPEIVEKLARLERENMVLAARVNSQGSEHLAALETELDDTKRLALSYEEKLDETRQSLSEARALTCQLSSDLCAMTATEAAAREELFSTQQRQAQVEAELSFKLRSCEMQRLKESATATTQAAALSELHHIAANFERRNLSLRLAESSACIEALRDELQSERSIRATAASELEAMAQVVAVAKEEHGAALALEREAVAARVAVIERAQAEAEAASSALTERLHGEMALVREAAAVEVAAAEARAAEAEALREGAARAHEAAKAEAQRISEAAFAAQGGLLRGAEDRLASTADELERAHREHIDAIAKKNHDLDVAEIQLKESESQVGELEAKLQKLMRVKSVLEKELHEASVCGEVKGDARAVMAELQLLQKEYRDLNERFKQAQEQIREGLPQANQPPSLRASHQQANSSLSDAVALFERRNQKLDDEKRELMMKCTAAVAEREQALQVIKDLQRNLVTATERATALELEKERAIRVIASRSAIKGQRQGKENSMNGEDRERPTEISGGDGQCAPS